MNNTVLISVIIPFYNEVQFLPTLVNTIVTQCIDNLEIIIVNDNPEEFGDQYFQSINLPMNTRVLHHNVNLGLPSSRNTGTRAAHGQYIAYIDADDFYLHNGLRDHLAFAIENDADVTHAQTVTTSLKNIRGTILSSDRAFYSRGKRGVYTGDELRDIGFHITSSWSSIYKTAFLRDNQICFDPTQRIFEDRLFVIDALLAAQSLAVMGIPTRVWRRRGASITTKVKTVEDRMLKLNSFSKSVERWVQGTSSMSRNWVVREFVQQSLNCVAKNKNSPFFDLFDVDSALYNKELTNVFLSVLDKVNATEQEIGAQFLPGNSRYAKKDSGNGRITVHDFVALLDALKHRDLETARRIIIAARFQNSDHKELPLLKVPSSDIEIFLHFGLHKTGSTHIQHQLDKNRKYLAKNGVLFPKTGLGFPDGIRSVRNQGLPGHQTFMSRTIEGDLSFVEGIAQEARDHDCKTIIISVENLSKPQLDNEAREHQIRTVVNALASIGRVTPVLLYRRPDVWLESYYRERLGNGVDVGSVSPSEFLLNNEQVLDFGGLVKSIENGCGSPIRMMAFEDAVSNDGDPVNAFLNLCGLSRLIEGLTAFDGTRYASMDNEHLDVARLVYLLVSDKILRQNILRDFYVLSTKQKNTRPLFTRQEKIRIIQLFCQSVNSENIGDRFTLPQDAWIREIETFMPQEPHEFPRDLLKILEHAAYVNGVLETPRKGKRRRKKKLYKKIRDRTVAKIGELYANRRWKRVGHSAPKRS